MNQLSPELLPDSIQDPAGYRRSRAMRTNYQAFRACAKHPAVAATKALSDKIRTGVYLLGLYARPLPTTGWQTPVSPLLLAAIHANADSAQYTLNTDMAQVAQFYQDAHLATYLAQQGGVYQRAIGLTRFDRRLFLGRFED